VKTNIGHSDAAAGIASLIKAVLAIEHGEIPPSLHFEAPNPEIDFTATPFYVNNELRSWPQHDRPRRAGVSSFGMGGSNAHVILEQAPLQPSSAPSRPWQLLTLSARTPTALETATDDLVAHLRANPGLPLADVAWTLRMGRRAFRHRRALVAASVAEAGDALAARDPRRVLSAGHEPGLRSVVFLLPGVGDQYAGISAGLYKSEPAFKAEMDRCAELFSAHLGLDLREVLFTEEPDQQANSGLDLRAMLRSREAGAIAPLQATQVAQPAVFAVGYSLARLWMSWGVQPQALLGYSLGEYTAACLAGVLSLPDAVELVAERARMISDLPRGAMLAVPLAEEDLVRRLPPELSIAAVNAPTVCVIAGPSEAVADYETKLHAEGLLCRRIASSHAFHSPMMQPVTDPFRALLRGRELKPPSIPYITNVTGTWVTTEQATDPEHWVRHLCQPVRFAEGIGELWREPGRVLVEVGPGQTLGSLALQHPASAGATAPLAIPSLRHAHDRQDDQAFLLRALGQLFLAGVEMDASLFWKGERRHRVPLPTYPFERQRYWLDRIISQPVRALPEAPPVRIAEIADWFHVPAWRMSLRPPEPAARRSGLWLVLADGSGLGERLAERLEARGDRVVVAWAGDRFTRTAKGRYRLAPAAADDFAALLDDLDELPQTIVHLWSITGEEKPPGRDGLGALLDRGFYSLIALAQVLGRHGVSQPLEIFAATDGLCAVERRDPLQPEKATLIGPVRVIAQEYPHLSCRAIDIDPGDPGLIDELISEIECGGAEPVLALRGSERWIPSTERIPLPARDGSPEGLRRGGAYLITGGLGGIGLAVAEYLAKELGARLVLVGRTPLPEREEWPRYLLEETPGLDPASVRKVRAVAALEATGAEVLIVAADVTDEERMCEVVALARSRFGRLDGVFHAAGLPGAGLIQLKERAAAAAVMAPKVEGTLALSAALRGEPGCFLVLFSALTGITGGIGQVDYCAANAFLDAFAQRSHRRGGARVLSIDWCEWQWDDWADHLTAMDSRLHDELKSQRLQFGLSFEEGMEALKRALASRRPQIVTSTRPLQIVLSQQHSMKQLLTALDRAPQGGDGHARPALPTPFVAAEGEVEGRLAAIWSELLGIQQIGAHDDFFQLGGHSLLGLQLISRIQETFQINLPLRILFEAPTIHELALAVASGGDAVDVPEIQRAEELDAQQVLARLDEMSEEEMDLLLAQMSEEGEGTRV
jgi:acyl transferase domain-containing protein/acyl carrier protein